MGFVRYRSTVSPMRRELAINSLLPYISVRAIPFSLRTMFAPTQMSKSEYAVSISGASSKRLGKRFIYAVVSARLVSG